VGAALCHEATVLDGIAGTWPPDDTGSSGLAVAKALVARGWAGSYLHAFTLDDVLHALSYQGPCLLGMNWRTLMDHPAVTTGRDRYAGPSRGGHEPLLTEVSVHRHRDGTLDEARSLVWIDNSWVHRLGRPWPRLHHRHRVPHVLADQGDVTIPIPPVAG